MRYKKFIIKGYRGISDITEINIARESIIPIIGKNESGKTTCLEAINAFDFTNDTENNGKHLNNIENLYSTIETPIVIAAEIEVEEPFIYGDEFKSYYDVLRKEFLVKYPEDEFDILKIDEDETGFTNIEFVKAHRILSNEIRESKALIIERDLRTKKYNLPILKGLLPDEFINSISEIFIKSLPYILYFDDFRDRMSEKVYIIQDKVSAVYSNWILYIDELFKQTKKEYSVFSLSTKQDSIRRSILKEAENYLNKVLIEEWSKYQFESNDSIKVIIEYSSSETGPFLQFKIVEEVFIEGTREERYFDISDRSKGFYWYFNFMLKLHFNPSKRDITDIDTIYLLDEPGSYLHTYALNKLAEQLKRLSLSNKVIYCTHFHNLLNPEFIPINSIRIAEKVNKGKIVLKRLDEAQLIRPQKNSPYQPVLDALEVKPHLFEFDFDNIILLEGIYDFYSFKMFTSNSLSYFPCVSASSIINQIPYMIFLGKKYLAVWDDDGEGRARLTAAKELFGEIESSKFMTLDALGNNENTRLEEYYDKTEIEGFKTNHMKKSNVSFYKAILTLFYSSEREALIIQYFPVTKNNFAEMEITLKGKLNDQETIQ